MLCSEGTKGFQGQKEGKTSFGNTAMSFRSSFQKLLKRLFRDYSAISGLKLSLKWTQFGIIVRISCVMSGLKKRPKNSVSNHLALREGHRLLN